MNDRFQPPLTGIHNFRDYGGYPADGGHVRRGLLYRSGHHVSATDADLDALRALNIRTVIDLRGISEREANPCRRHEGWEGEVLGHDGETSSMPPHMETGDRKDHSAESARNRMLSVYTRMPANPAMHSMFARYLNALAERDGATLVHCFAGKDRTGIAATLLLHILGVSEEDQLEEFLLTNQAPTLAVLRAQTVPILEARIGQKLEEGAIKARLEVGPDYLARFHETVRAMSGSLDEWLGTVIGIDDALRERLRAKYIA